MTKLWKMKTEIPQTVAESLSEYPRLVQQFLYNRQLLDKADIQKFLKPKYENLHNPFLFKDMTKAVGRIWQAIAKNEKICIYGDYDADAVTANAVLRQTLLYLNANNAQSYIPDRFSEGYGVNLSALEKISQSGVTLVVTVDCGTNAVDAAEWCQARGIDLIITDHHEIIGKLPGAYALINPKNPFDVYPYSEITGVGVAFKLACGILSEKEKVVAQLANDRLRQPATYVAGWEKWLLDLVAIGTVADCHTLIGENRVLVKYGLQVLRKTKWSGLKALISTSGLDFSKKDPDTYSLGFVLAPRINAAGRLDHANVSLDLLLEENLEIAHSKALELEEVNKRRQDITARIMSEAREQALLIKDRKIIVMMSQDWHKGVVGLVAGKIADEFYKPAIILEQGELESTGSARSVGAFNIVEALKYSDKFLIRFGGHKAAAGLTLKTEQFSFFYEKILEYAEKEINKQDSQSVLEIEAELEPTDLQFKTYEIISALEPFGVSNPKPKFLLKNVRVIFQRSVGVNGQHLQLQLQHGHERISAIAFNFRPLSFESADFVCELIKDVWQNRNVLKLRIIDFRKS